MKIVISVPVLGFADSVLLEKSESLTRKNKLNRKKGEKINSFQN